MSESKAMAPKASVSPADGGHPLTPHRELLIAWTLLLLERDKTHGYKLLEELRARGLEMDAGALYRLLHSLEREGSTRSRWAAAVAGPRRRVYALTKQGRKTLHALSALIAATSETYSIFLRGHQHAVTQRAGGPAELDEQTPPPVHAITTGQASSDPLTSPVAPTLRPHRELLAGWLLLRLDSGPTYGYDLRRVFAAHGLMPDASAMYRMLRRLEADKWLQSRWLSSSVGPRRRFYHLTTRGWRNLDEIAAVITAIRDLHDAYLREYEHAHPLTASDRSAAA